VYMTLDGQQPLQLCNVLGQILGLPTVSSGRSVVANENIVQYSRSFSSRTKSNHTPNAAVKRESTRHHAL